MKIHKTYHGMNKEIQYIKIQKQPSIGVLIKRRSGNMQQI